MRPQTTVAIGSATPIGNKYKDLIILINFDLRIRRSAKPKERAIWKGLIIIVNIDVIFKDCQNSGSSNKYW